MRIWFGILLATALLGGGPAVAGPWRDLRMAQGQPDRYEQGPRRQREAGRDERFERREHHERQKRLSEAERHELHRDLDKARREIYKPRRDR